MRPSSSVLQSNDFTELNYAVLIFIVLQMRKERGIA